MHQRMISNSFSDDQNELSRIDTESDGSILLHSQSSSGSDGQYSAVTLSDISMSEEDSEGSNMEGSQNLLSTENLPEEIEGM